MFTLYYYPRNASMAPHLLLEELKAEFELILVDRKTEAQKSAEYLKLNPAGRIPTLVDDDLVLFESAAICLYICEQFPESKLIPETGTTERAQFFQWLMYITNTFQNELLVYFYPEKHTLESNGIEAIKQAHEKRLNGVLEILEKELNGKEYLIGDELSVCDFYLFMPLIWAGSLAKPPVEYPNLKRFLKNMSKLKSVKCVAEKETIDLAIYK